MTGIWVPLLLVSADVSVENYSYNGTAYLKIADTDGLTCEAGLVPQLNLGSILVPGVSKLSYTSSGDGSTATFTEPSATPGVDPRWLADHPHLLAGTFTASGDYVPPDAEFLIESGLVVPDIDPGAFDSTRCNETDCEAMDPTADPMLVAFQKARALNQTPVADMYKYATTGALDFRSSGAANAKYGKKLERLVLSDEVRDGTTLNLAAQNVAGSFASKYTEAQRKVPGLLPLWSPHSPFMDPATSRDGIYNDPPYKAGKPFHRYALKPCPGLTDGSCCLSLESALLMQSSPAECDPDNHHFCGKNNPVASLFRPGSLPAELLTDHEGPADRRLSLKLRGLSTAFSRAIPDLGSGVSDSTGNALDLPKAALSFKTYLGTMKNIDNRTYINSDENGQIEVSGNKISLRNSPKCKFLEKEGGGSRIAVMFAEHFYVALSGDVKRIKHRQQQFQRPFREGQTEYVRPSSQSRYWPAETRHILEMFEETENDLPPSERLAFMFGPRDTHNGFRLADDQVVYFFNDADTPCSQIGGGAYRRSIGESNETVGTGSNSIDNDGTCNESRCMCRRIGKWEWALQAVLAPLRAGGSDFREMNSGVDCVKASKVFGDKDSFLELINTKNRVVLWDVDAVFDVPKYVTARFDDADREPFVQYSELVRLHTTAPVAGKDPEPFTGFRNLRGGLPGANNVVPVMDRTQCNEFQNSIGNDPVCDLCLLAGNIQISQAVGMLTEGTCTNPSEVTGTGGRNFNYLPHCCEPDENGNLFPIELTSDLIWNALKRIGKYNFNATVGAEHELPGTGKHIFGDPIRGPADYGTSDGTPRSNVHAATCHLDPRVDTEFLMAPMGQINIGTYTTTQKTGFSTMSAGSLWPGSSFRDAPAEPAQSLAGGSDMGTRRTDTDLTIDMETLIGENRVKPSLGSVERWDFDMASFPQKFDVQANGGSIRTVLTEADVTTSHFFSKRERYAVHTCADEANRTFFTPWFFGGRGAPIGDSKSVNVNEDCTCCLSTRKPLNLVGRMSGAAEEWDLRWTFSRMSANAGTQNSPDDTLIPYGSPYSDLFKKHTKDLFEKPISSLGMKGATSDGRGNSPRGGIDGGGQSRFPSFVADFFNNVRYGNDRAYSVNPKHFYASIANATGCCSIDTNDRIENLCVCNAVTKTNPAGEPCTTVGIPQMFDKNYGGNSAAQYLDQYKNHGKPYHGNQMGQIKTAGQCFSFRVERGDGAIVASARPSRGGSPATPSATLGSVRLPPIQYHFNAEFCPQWDICSEFDGSGSKQCNETDQINYRLTYGRLGARDVGTPETVTGYPGAVSPWNTVNPNLVNVGILDSERRCFNGLEGLGEVVGPMCTKNSFKGLLASPDTKTYPDTCGSKKSPTPGSQPNQATAIEKGTPDRNQFLPPFIHPSKMAPQLDSNNCPTSPGPTVRGLDQMNQIFEFDLLDQSAVGRVSWGARTFNDAGSEDETVMMPKAQYHYTTTAPYSAGKRDGILECGGASTFPGLRKALLRHSILKSTDVCVNDVNTYDDEGVSLDTDRSAPFRDHFSSCVNPADAATAFCSQLIVDSARSDANLNSPAADPVGTCENLFGNGRAFAPEPEIAATYRELGVLVDTGRTDGRTDFPASCFCTGGDAIIFPRQSDTATDDDLAGGFEDERLSYLSTLCACGSVARTTTVIIGTETREAPETNYEVPPHADGTQPTGICDCDPTVDSSCVPRHGCHREYLKLSVLNGMPTETELDAVASDTIGIERLPINFVVRRTIEFENAAKIKARPAMPFTAIERESIKTCLVAGVDCAGSQSSFGDAMLTYPIDMTGTDPNGEYSRAIVLPVSSTGCPEFSPHPDAGEVIERLVTNPEAPFSALAPLFDVSGSLQALPVKADKLLQPRLFPVGSSNFAVFDYMLKTSRTEPQPSDTLGCFLAGTTDAAPAFDTIATAAGTGNDAGIAFGPPLVLPNSNLSPVTVAHSFVFDGAAGPVRRFSELLRNCLELVARISTGIEDGLETEVRTGLCFNALSPGNPAAEPGRSVFGAVAPFLVEDANVAVAATGGCVSIRGVPKLFTVVAIADADGRGTFLFPIDCHTDIYFRMVKLSELADPFASGDPAVIVGTEYALAGTKVPNLVPVPAVLEKFPEPSFPFPANLDSGFSTSTASVPCWSTVCDGGVGAIVISVEGRLGPEDRFFEPGNDTHNIERLTNTAFLADNCGRYTPRDNNFLKAYDGFTEKLAGGRTIDDWRFPGSPVDPAAVRQSPLITACVEKNTVRLFPGRSIGVAVSTGTTHAAGLTSDYAFAITATGPVSAAAFPLDPSVEGGMVVLPLAELPLDSGDGIIATVGNPTTWATITSVGKIENCAPFFADEEPKDDWQSCVDAIAPISMEIDETSAAAGDIVIRDLGIGPLCGAITDPLIVGGGYPAGNGWEKRVLDPGDIQSVVAKCAETCREDPDCVSIAADVDGTCSLGAAEARSFAFGWDSLFKFGETVAPVVIFCGPAEESPPADLPVTPSVDNCPDGSVNVAGTCVFSSCDFRTEFTADAVFTQNHGRCPESRGSLQSSVVVTPATVAPTVLEPGQSMTVDLGSTGGAGSIVEIEIEVDGGVEVPGCGPPGSSQTIPLFNATRDLNAPGCECAEPEIVV